MTLAQAIQLLGSEGILLESARNAEVPNLADRVLGVRSDGGWWTHPHAREFFRLTRKIRSHGDVLVCTLVAGKITYVHRRLWPALVRVAPTLDAARVAAMAEIHTESGAHRVRRTPLASWVPPEVRSAAQELTLDEARLQLGAAAPAAVRSRRGARDPRSARPHDTRAPESSR